LTTIGYGAQALQLISLPNSEVASVFLSAIFFAQVFLLGYLFSSTTTKVMFKMHQVFVIPIVSVIFSIICANFGLLSHGKEIQFHTKNVSITESHRLYIREMTLEAWKAYEKFAWGADVLKPAAKV